MIWLNVAPLVMKSVVYAVLAQDAEIERAVLAYVDDLLVDEEVVSADRVVESVIWALGHTSSIRLYGAHWDVPMTCGLADKGVTRAFFPEYPANSSFLLSSFHPHIVYSDGLLQERDHA